MKSLAKFACLAGFAILLSVSVVAGADPSIRGEFKIEPKSEHTGVITGQMDLTIENDELKLIKVKLDAPISDQSEYVSTEQWMLKSTVAETLQLSFAYKLEGPTHGWYFVVVGKSAEGTTYDANMYKVRAKLGDIQKYLKKGVALSPDGKFAVPAAWKFVGTATLKY